MRPEDRLFEQLPAIYREPVVERQPVTGIVERFPLRALMQIVTEQADLVRDDIRRLWENFFIETCQRWAIPYIGDLVANDLLHDGSRSGAPDTAHQLFDDLVGRDLRPAIAIRTRADVAKTIYYRRRKGTVPMLEELARDVTGWPAHVVEFFELLNWTQTLNHLRWHSTDGPDLRRVEVAERVDGPFDEFSHTVDVRPIGQAEGWHNIPNIGFFLWRLLAYPAERVVARRAGPAWRYHFSPLGQPAPLFSRWRREGAELRTTTELDVPAPIRPAAFLDDLERYQANPPAVPSHTEYYGPFGQDADVSFVIIEDGVPVDPLRIRCRDLSTWIRPAGDAVAVDVRLGRIAFGLTVTPAQVDVFYHYGFSADLGGGPYERAKWLVRPELADLRVNVWEGAPNVAPDFSTLGGAIAHWDGQGRPNAIITILDNRTYAEPLTVRLRDQHWLIIQAENRARPHVVPTGGSLIVADNHPESELTLSGLLLEGAVHVTGNLGRLRLLHTTLVPGRALAEDGTPVTVEPSLVVEADSGGAAINEDLKVEIAFSITGPLRLPELAQGLWILDSIVDGLPRPPLGLHGEAIAGVGPAGPPGPRATLERVSVLGTSRFRELPLASESIFTGAVEVVRRQDGCVRFSFVPEGSATPRRSRCQPDTEVAAGIEALEAEPGFATLPEAVQLARKTALRDEIVRWLVPSFTTLRYGQPAYAQLRLGCPVAIRTGSEDGSEMGAFCHLKQPQRETNLRIRLDEYLPFGLDAGMIYVT